jgi:Lipocalin-like domain
MLGSWKLVRFETRDTATGAVRQPLGSDPRGLILYTEDGYMSAQLAPGSGDAELSDYIAYTGPFHVDEQAAIVHHEVAMATMADLLAAPQLRAVTIGTDTMTLAATMTDDTGTTTRSTLTWRRANR